MSNTVQLQVPITLSQIIELVKKLPKAQQLEIAAIINEQDDFALNKEQLKLLKKRRKTPVADCFSAKDALDLLRKNHDL